MALMNVGMRKILRRRRQQLENAEMLFRRCCFPEQESGADRPLLHV